jgi:molecular chaperone Hsp33
MADDLQRTPDDYVLPFQIETSGARGRLVRMGPAISAVLGKHAYPDAVSTLLGEAMTLTTMLGASLKFDGRFILQTSSQGPVNFLVAHYYAPGNIRGYASFDEAAFGASSAEAPAGSARLLGEGHLAMTIDQGPEMERYQGIVPLEGTSISEAADLYFRQSEQLPTFIKIAIARHYEGGKDDKRGAWSWRAGGLMVQKLTSEGGAAPQGNGHDADDAWTRSKLLASTVEDHELLDPMLAPERLLYRLFHEEQVRAFDAKPIAAFCQCSRERVEQMLASFSQEEIEDMIEGGRVQVTCQFCNAHYDFDGDVLMAQRSPVQ